MSRDEDRRPYSDCSNRFHRWFSEHDARAALNARSLRADSQSDALAPSSTGGKLDNLTLSHSRCAWGYSESGGRDHVSIERDYGSRTGDRSRVTGARLVHLAHGAGAAVSAHGIGSANARDYEAAPLGE